MNVAQDASSLESSPPAARPVRPSFLSPLAHRAFALAWSGRAVSLFGSVVELAAQAWLVAGMQRSGASVAAVAVAATLPRVALGPLAGTVVDRIERRTLLRLGEAATVAQSAVFLALYLSGHASVPALLALATFRGTVDAFLSTGYMTLAPRLLPRELVGRGVGLFALADSLSQLLGPALSGLLIASVGLSTCMVANMASCLVPLVTLSLLAPLAPAAIAAGETVAGGLRDAFRVVRSTPVVWAVARMVCALSFFGLAAAQLLVLYARAVVHTDARGYGALLLAAGIGSVVASVFVAGRASEARLPRNALAGAAGVALAVGALAFVRSVPMALAVTFLFGLGQMAFVTAMTALVQLNTPREMHGRVLGVMRVQWLFRAVGAIAWGAATDALARHGRGPDAVAHAMSVTALVASAAVIVSIVLLARPMLSRTSAR